MGWGTFIAGRALRAPRRKPSLLPSQQEMQRIRHDFLRRQVDLETEVLSEIAHLKSQNKVFDINDVRKSIRKKRRTIEKLGPELDLKVVKRVQEKTMAGETFNVDALEAEIISEHMSSRDLVWWMNVILWMFVPYKPWRTRIIKSMQV